MLGYVAVENIARRGRPPNYERRRAIVRTALHLLARYGFDGMPMRVVAQECGISEPLLFRYYRSKRELLDAVIDYVMEQYDVLIAGTIVEATRPSTLRAFLTTVARRVVAFNEQLGGWYAVQSTSPISREARRRIAETRERGFQALARAMSARGVFADPYVAARSFVGAIVYDDVLRRNGKEPQPSPQLQAVFVEQLVDLVAAGRELPPRGND